MPFNGSGSYNLTDGTRTGRDVHSKRKSEGAKLDAQGLDNIINDLGDALQSVVTKNGETGALSVNLDLGNHKLVNVATAIDAQDGVNFRQLSGSPWQFSNSTFASNVYSVTLNPVPVGYISGMTVKFWANNANTAIDPSINVNGLGAVTIKHYNSLPIQIGTIATSSLIEVVFFAGTFYLLNVDSSRLALSGGIMAGILNMSGNRITNLSAGTAITDVARMSQLLGVSSYGSATFSSNNYSLTLNPGITSYQDGQRVYFYAPTANTASDPTLDVNGLGAGTLKTARGGVIYFGCIQAGSYVEAMKVGSNWHIMSPLSKNESFTPSSVTWAPNGGSPTQIQQSLHISIDCQKQQVKVYLNCAYTSVVAGNTSCTISGLPIAAGTPQFFQNLFRNPSTPSEEIYGSVLAGSDDIVLQRVAGGSFSTAAGWVGQIEYFY
jgi:hypothetical protein